MSAKSYGNVSFWQKHNLGGWIVYGLLYALRFVLIQLFKLILMVLTRADHASRRQFPIADALTRLFGAVLVPLCGIVAILFAFHPTSLGLIEALLLFGMLFWGYVFRPIAPFTRQLGWDHPALAALGIADMDRWFPPKGYQKSKVVMRRR